jgi:hypothetical protein
MAVLPTISLSVQIQQDHHLDHTGAVKDMMKSSLVNPIIIVVSFLLLVPTIVIPAKLNNIDPETLNSSPGAEMYQFLDHGLTAIITASFVAIYYFRNETMRKTVFREIKEDFMLFKEWLQQRFQFLNPTTPSQNPN